MTEDQARSWVRDRYGVSRETALERFGALLIDEATRQNLISASTIPALWSRHLVDSAQLLPLAESAGLGPWVDIGSGAGLPGLVLALLDETRPMVLVEPRAKRVEFLRRSADTLGIARRVTVVQSRIESWTPKIKASVISARAVAELSALFAASAHSAEPSTIWLLPKGRNAQSEVEAARRAWQGVFHVEPSITQPDSGIVVARKVRVR